MAASVIVALPPPPALPPGSTGIPPALSLPKKRGRRQGGRRRQRLQVGDELHQLILRDGATVARHDRGVSGHDILRRKEDGIAQIRLVCSHDAAVREMNSAAVNAVKVRRVNAGGWRMAAGTAERTEQSFALMGEIV